MPRTDVAAVLSIVGTTSLDAAQVGTLIADASDWIDRELEGKCSGQTADSLEAVERYLAAHMVSRTEGSSGALKSASRSDISESYDTSGDKDFPLRFARMAATWDRCGIIAERWLGGRRVRASFVRGYADV